MLYRAVSDSPLQLTKPVVEQNKMEQVTESTKSKQKIPLPAELIVLYIEQPKPKRKRRDDDDDDSSLADKDDNSGDAGSAGTGGIVTDSYGNLRPADGSSHVDELKEAHRASSSHSDKLKEAHRASSSHSVELKDARHASSSRSDELQDARHSNTSYEHKDSQKVTLQNPKAARMPIAEKRGAEVQDVGIRNSNGGRESSSNDVGASAPKSGSSSTSNSTDELNKEKKEIKQNQTKGTGNGSSIVQKVDSSVAGLNTSGWSKQNNNHATAQASNGNSANNAQKPANNNTQSIKQATQSADQAKNQAKQGLSNNPQQWGYSMQGKSNGSGWSDAGAGRPSSSAQSVPTNTSRKGAERAERAEQQQQNKNVKPQKSHADMVRMDSNYSTGTPHEAGMNSAGRSETAQKIPHQNSSRNGAEKAEELDTVKPKTRAKILADKFTDPLRRQEGIMLTNGSASEKYTMLEGILGFEIVTERVKPTSPVNGNAIRVSCSYADHRSRKPPIGGVDLINGNSKDTSYGTPLVSMADGTIQYFDDGDTNKGYGFYAIISFEKDGDQYQMYYAHMIRPENSKDLVAAGPQPIKAGDPIGQMGNTGNCHSSAGGAHPCQYITEQERKDKWGTHLHWEIRKKNKKGEWESNINPMEFIF